MRGKHPEPCPTPACPFAIGSRVAVIEGRYAGLSGEVIEINACGIEREGKSGKRHIAICECQVKLDRHPSRPMWFRYDRELVVDPDGPLLSDSGPQRALRYEERGKVPKTAPGGSEGKIALGRP